MRQEYIITQVYHKAFFERYRKNGDEPIDAMLQPLIDAAREVFQIRKRFGREHPTVII